MKSVTWTRRWSGGGEHVAITVSWTETTTSGVRGKETVEAVSLAEDFFTGLEDFRGVLRLPQLTAAAPPPPEGNKMREKKGGENYSAFDLIRAGRGS